VASLVTSVIVDLPSFRPIVTAEVFGLFGPVSRNGIVVICVCSSEAGCFSRVNCDAAAAAAKPAGEVVDVEASSHIRRGYEGRAFGKRTRTIGAIRNDTAAGNGANRLLIAGPRTSRNVAGAIFQRHPERKRHPGCVKNVVHS